MAKKYNQNEFTLFIFESEGIGIFFIEWFPNYEIGLQKMEKIPTISVEKSPKKK